MPSACFPSVAEIHILLNASCHLERHQGTLTSAPKEPQIELNPLLNPLAQHRDQHEQSPSAEPAVLLRMLQLSPYLLAGWDPSLLHGEGKQKPLHSQKTGYFPGTPNLLLSCSGTQAWVRATSVFGGHHMPLPEQGSAHQLTRV